MSKLLGPIGSPSGGVSTDTSRLASKENLEAAGQRFEAVFTGMMLKSMRQARLGDGLFDGGDGFDTVVLGSYALADLLSFDFDGTLVDLALQTANGVVTAQFTNFENWMFGNGDSYSTSALAAAVPASQVPLPAGMALLLGGLGGFAALRRRKA